MQYTTDLFRHYRRIIGANIHALRVRRRLSLHKLARLCELAPARLDHYELGKSEIRLQELLKIACALGVSVERLFPGAEKARSMP